jgi:AbiV family abortive infection protein
MKNFQTLSRKECEEAAIVCFAHAESKYNDAVILATGNASYGNGISNLILCIEDTMKGLILSLDADGFNFRNKVKGIKGLFENHKLRYFLGFTLSCIHLISEDLVKLLLTARENPKKLIQQVKIFKNDPKFIEAYWKETMSNMQEEVEWFSHLDERRQSGMYVGYKNELKSPNAITKEEFEEFLKRVDMLRLFSILIANSYRDSVDEVSAEIEEIHKTFKEEKYYTHLGNLITLINDRKSDSFEDLRKNLEELKNDIKG